MAGSFKRFLITRGERVGRVATRLKAGSSRARGKSDRIDGMAVARAALRERHHHRAVAQLAGIELKIRLLVDHGERLVQARTALDNDLRWHLHDLCREISLPGCALLSRKWISSMSRRRALRRPLASGSSATSCDACAN